MAEHLHTVTRTISNPLPDNPEPKSGAAGDHIVLFRADSTGSHRDVAPGSAGSHVVVIRSPSFEPAPAASGSNDIFRPSTHTVIRRSESSEEPGYMTQLEARRLSKMHNFLVNYE